MSRAELLEQHGRAFGALRLAVAFTAGLDGDDAKRVTARGWDRTPRLADPEQGAAILRTRGERRNPAIVLRPSGLVGVDVDGPEGVELLRRLVPEGMPRTVAVETGKNAGYHLWYLAPDGGRSAFVELGPEGVTDEGRASTSSHRPPFTPRGASTGSPTAGRRGSSSSPCCRSGSSNGSSAPPIVSGNSAPSQSGPSPRADDTTT